MNKTVAGFLMQVGSAILISALSGAVSSIVQYGVHKSVTRMENGPVKVKQPMGFIGVAK